MNPCRMFLVAPALALLGSAPAMAAEPRSQEDVARMLAIDMPHPGKGKLATVRSLGPNRPSEPSMLVIATADGSVVAGNAHPDEARWRNPTELIVDSFDRPIRDRSSTRITRVDAGGREIAELFDRTLHSAPRPSPDGRWLALTTLHGKTGKQRLEIFGFGADDRLGEPRVFHELPPYNLAWSPDGRHIAVGVGVVEPTGKVWPRLRILDVAAGTIREVADGGRPDGVRPMFWTEEGLFVESEPGVRRCDLDGGGCRVHYDVGYPRFRARAATPVGNGKAWVLVTDFARDAFETRGHELHEMDLVHGGGRRLLRLPDGVFLEDISWIGE